MGGNIDSKRDWGHARDYVEAMYLMTQQERADDFVVATGETHSVREFVEKAFAHLDIKIKWQGEQGTQQEEGVEDSTGRVLVKIDPKYFRPTEVDLLIGNPAKAKRVLDWEPKITFEQLVREMVDADVKLVEQGDLN